jgi:hypothetical protein
MAKQRKSNSKYTNAIRQRNKKRKLEKTLKHLEECRKIEIINPNTKLPPKRKPLENIVKNCRIGRKAEGFQPEAFKKNKSKVIIVPKKKGK